MKVTFTLVTALANDLGLSVAKYNPGDGARYKVDLGLDYHASSAKVWLSLREVYAYLQGLRDERFRG